jgi:cysteate synthase
MFEPTQYKLLALCCNKVFDEQGWSMDCPDNHRPALIRAMYAEKRLTLRNELPGLYRYADWLPISSVLQGSSAPVTYKSNGLANVLGLQHLYITFSGYWPERGAFFRTASFKECEAYSVCGRLLGSTDRILVVASAGNTARAFAQVCSENKIPLLLTVPQDNLDALWFGEPLNSCVKLVVTEKGSDYFDAIRLANAICKNSHFIAEGGAKNIARRDGMGTTVLSAVTTIGEIPHYYFQAVGSGTGAIAAWEANMRFVADGRFGDRIMQLMVSQNIPFIPMAKAFEQHSRELLPYDDTEARSHAEEIKAKVLSNRKPPYSLIGGLFDALVSTGGDVLTVTNDEADAARKLFAELEGIDIEQAAAVAVASLVTAVKENRVETDKIIMLNITGGGAQRFKTENKTTGLTPSIVFPIDFNEVDAIAKALELFDL